MMNCERRLRNAVDPNRLKNIPLDPPSKGEARATLRVVFGTANNLGSEQVTLYTPTAIVTHNSPFEGGSRGMFFFPRDLHASEVLETIGTAETAGTTETRQRIRLALHKRVFLSSLLPPVSRLRTNSSCAHHSP
jgi:hypothetical protein